MRSTSARSALPCSPYGKHPYGTVLRNEAFEVRLAEILQPSCHVQFASKALWADGLDGLESRFGRWIASLGFVAYRPESVSRADWAFDYHLPALDFVEEHVTSRAAKNASYSEHRVLQTLTFGTGDVVVRIYDKVAEIEQASKKAWFFDLWGRADAVWRIEFQVRKERLKAGGIRCLDDLRDLQADLLRELATKHTQLRRPSGDSNRSRWPLHPLWQALVEDIGRLPQTGLVRSIDPQMPLDWRMRKQVQSLYGNLRGIAAAQSVLSNGSEPLELDDMLEALPALLSSFHSDEQWNDELTKRIAEHRLGMK